MPCRAIFGLVVAIPLSLAAARAANAPGITHVMENGEPVVIVRLVPPEGAVAPGPRINALDTPPAHVDPNDAGAEANQGGVNDALTDPNAAGAQDNAAIAPDGMAQPDPDAADLATQSAAPVARYPGAKPTIKPGEPDGVGGALDLVPPTDAAPASPKPMRLNNVERPRRAVQREPRPEPRAPAPRQRAERPVQPVQPVQRPYDPLDEALPSRIVDAPQPVTPAPIAITPLKDEARITTAN